MSDRYIIEGSLIRHERIETVSEAPLEALTQHLVRRIGITWPTLPQHPVRFTAFDGETERGIFFCETPPALRHISVRHASNSNFEEDRERRGAPGGGGIWRVQFPWQYFIFPFRTMTRQDNALTSFTLEQTLLFWSRDPLRGAEAATATLVPALVPNVDSAGVICWGQTTVENASLDARIDDYINSFTTTLFNEDLGHATPFHDSLSEWERNSPAASMAWRDWPIWTDNPRATTPQEIATARLREAATLPPMADINASHVDIPLAPLNFTALRAREYIDGLTPAARLRFLAALQLPDEAEAEAEAEIEVPA